MIRVKAYTCSIMPVTHPTVPCMSLQAASWEQDLQLILAATWAANAGNENELCRPSARLIHSSGPGKGAVAVAAMCTQDAAALLPQLTEQVG